MSTRRNAGRRESTLASYLGNRYLRRGKLIVLTDPGKRLIDEAIGRHVANEERLLLSLTQAEQETLSALLKKLIAGLRG